jgi:hypothetical protein
MRGKKNKVTVIHRNKSVIKLQSIGASINRNSSERISISYEMNKRHFKSLSSQTVK